MRKLKLSSLETATGAVFIILMLLMPLVHLAFYSDGLSYTFLTDMQQKLLFVGAVASLVVLIFYFINVNKYKISLPDVFLWVLTVCGIISVVFSFDSNMSLWGGNESNEGLITFISYFIIFTLAACVKTENTKTKILFTFMCIGAAYALYGIFQNEGMTSITSDSFLFNLLGTCITSAISVIFGGVAVGFYLHNKNKVIRYVSLAFGILFFVNILFSREPMALFSFGVMLVFALIGEIVFAVVSKKLIGVAKVLSFALLLVAIAYLINFIANKCFDKGLFTVWSTLGFKSALTYKSGFNVSLLWENMLKYFNGLSNKWFTGLGVDGVRTKVITSEKTLLIYKIYNNYLQVLFSQGCIAFAAYVGFIITVIIKAVKRFICALKENGEAVAMYSPLILAILGYCVFMICNFTVISVEPFFWIICGFACCRYVGEKKLPQDKERVSQLKNIKSKIDDINK